MIRIIPHNKIDFEAWDFTIQYALHSEIYAQSWFLSTVSPQWKAAVYGNYEFIMPLPIKSKYGIRYIVQPPFCQKLGIFSRQHIPNDIREACVKQLLKHASVRYASYDLLDSRFSQQRANFVLPLHDSVKDLQARYSTNCVRNLTKAQQEGLHAASISVEAFITFYESVIHFKLPQSYKQGIERLLVTAESKHALRIIGAYKDNELVSAVAFFVSPNRIYYLLAASSTYGKDARAMFFIIDWCISQYAGSNTVLDFEGSELEGVARFYEGFGAVKEPYYVTQHHSIPFIQKFIT